MAGRAIAREATAQHQWRGIAAQLLATETAPNVRFVPAEADDQPAMTISFAP